VADRVDTAMEAVKPALLDPVADGAATETAFDELPAAHYAVLSVRQAPDHPIELARMQLGPIVGPNVTKRVHAAILAGPSTRETARTSRIRRESEL
jgi:hypothetical protein